MTRSVSRFGLACIAVVALAGCSNLSQTQQRTLSGGAIGAGVGTATTLVTGGCVSCGAAIGGVAGAAGGYIYDQVER